ncbi:MAG: hypothetical protein WDN04_27000 [Rhodospirillales bacterium]
MTLAVVFANPGGVARHPVAQIALRGRRRVAEPHLVQIISPGGDQPHGWHVLR